MIQIVLIRLKLQPDYALKLKSLQIFSASNYKCLLKVVFNHVIDQLLSLSTFKNANHRQLLRLNFTKGKLYKVRALLVLTERRLFICRNFYKFSDLTTELQFKLNLHTNLQTY